MRDPKATAAAAVTLPEDVVLEILARVPDVADLFRCAVACKRWRVLVADRPFLRRHWPEDARHPSSLLGFFGQDWWREDVPAPLPDFVSAPRSVLGPGRPFLGSFVPGAAGLFDRAVPLASNRGLLLVRYVPRGGDPHMDGTEPTVDHLAVCNLLSGTCDLLPPLQCGRFSNYLDTSAYAVLTGADCCPRSGHPPCPPAKKALFKVLVIGISQSGTRYDLHTVSSGEQSWSAPTKCFSPIEHNMFGPIMQRDAVVRRGTVHWLLWDMVNFHALNVDAVTGRVSLHMLPAPRPQDLVRCMYDNPRLSVAADGTTLSSLCLFREDLTVEIWTWRHDDGDDDGERGHWRRDRVVELRRPKQKQINGPLCMCMGERSGTMLIRADCRCIYIADLESGVLEEVTDQFSGLAGWKTAFPMEIDWPAFFMHRLGGKPIV
ncbi:hypothetical protein QYE76_057614 [Lolium multiflorum]|uniref:F-box domain-containing protein n=1 Tax=Lolium multiflorum TaxID=4521 RepID=A0AAD8T4S0_LOLMU|nr:hypothetical protein QYE76_057614 [Lolium multiflorum]